MYSELKQTQIQIIIFDMCQISPHIRVDITTNRDMNRDKKAGTKRDASVRTYAVEGADVEIPRIIEMRERNNQGKQDHKDKQEQR